MNTKQKIIEKGNLELTFSEDWEDNKYYFIVDIYDLEKEEFIFHSRVEMDDSFENDIQTWIAYYGSKYGI